MTLVVAAAGLVGGLLGWPLLRPVLAAPALARENHRGEQLATAGGLVLVVVALAAASVAVVVGDTADPFGAGDRTVWQASGIAVLGFGFLGLVDDIAALGPAGGFRGHVADLARGRLTTGGLKLLGGAAVAVVAVGSLGSDDLVVVLGDAAIVALAANLANLLDLRPARTTKAAVLAWIGLLATGGLGAVLHPASLVVGGAVGLAVPEVREKVMLGDTGSNVVGAVLGLTAVTVLSGPARIVVGIVLVGLNAVSEVISFSRIIDGVPPLRWLDRLGRG